MSFRPNTTGLLLRKQAKRNIHGKEFFDAPQPVAIAIVHLADKVEETSVRADSSASRGSGEQDTLQAKILVGPAVLVSEGDVIKVAGRIVEVASIHQRFDVFGRHHHNELGGNIKGDI
jgi:hypothetical protein